MRACHVTGEFVAKDNKRGAYSGQHRLAGPPRFEYGRLAHPPVIFTQERLKVEERLPAAQKFIREQKLNEVIPGDVDEIGIIVLGGLTNNLLRALARLDLADLYGASRIPIYVLNVAYPLVPEEVKDFCAGKRAVLVVEEGSPEYVEQQINVILRGADISTRVLGKGCLSRSGDYNSEALLRGIAAFLTADASRRHRCRCGCQARGRISRAQAGGRGRRRRHPGAAAEFLHRLSGAAGVRRHQAGRSARSARPISAPTSAAIRSRPSRRSRSAIRSSATACRSPAPPRSARTWQSARSRSWATAASGTTA